MKYEPTTEMSGGLRGMLPLGVKYSKLVEMFGEPGDGDDYKVSTEWAIKFEDGVTARIYDWKASELYEPGAYPVSKIRSDDLPFDIEWHIGGDDPVIVERILKILGLEET